MSFISLENEFHGEATVSDRWGGNENIQSLITLIAGMAIMSAVVYQLSIAKRGTSAIKGT